VRNSQGAQEKELAEMAHATPLDDDLGYYTDEEQLILPSFYELFGEEPKPTRKRKRKQKSMDVGVSESSG
jgi:hypothetical protein